MTPLPQNWPALVAGVRLARVMECDQRAYKDANGYVRFCPSGIARWSDTEWDKHTDTEAYCIARDTRLPDHEAARLWATRPQKET